MWGMIKNRIFSRQIGSIDELKKAIRHEFVVINKDLALLRRMVKAKTKRYLKRIEVKVAQFEHLL